MKHVFCKDEKDFCNPLEGCMKCESANGNGTTHGDVTDEVLATLFGLDYDLNRLLELVEADKAGRLYKFRYSIGSTVYRIWVRPDGSHPFISEHKMESISDMTKAEFWHNAYSTKEEAEAAIKKKIEVINYERICSR